MELCVAGPGEKKLLPRKREEFEGQKDNLEGELGGKLDAARTAAAEERIADADVTGGGDDTAAPGQRIKGAPHFTSTTTIELKSAGQRVGQEGRQVRAGKVRVVQDVKEICPELQLYALGQGRVFVNCKVPLFVGGTNQRTTPHVAEVTGARDAVAR